jgi:hypothetical protein
MSIKKLSHKERAKVAKMEMLPFTLCGLAAMTAKLDANRIPDTLSECQADLKSTKGLLASALGSHLVCHARLQIAEESAKKIGKTAQDNQLDKILKGCKS